MKKDIIIDVNAETSKVTLPTDLIGVNGENLQGNLIFKFEDTFVNGIARLEIDKNNEKTYEMTTKVGESYILPILSSLLDCKIIYMQLVITEKAEDKIPIFKSKMFYLKVLDSINAKVEQPEQYPTWPEFANAKLAEMDNALEETKAVVADATKQLTQIQTEMTEFAEAEQTRQNSEEKRVANENDRTTAEQTRVNNETIRQSNEGIRQTAEQIRTQNEKERNTAEATRKEYINQLKKDVEDGKFNGKNGTNGKDGKDATINGVNVLEIEAGDNIKIEQEDGKMKISASGGGTDIGLFIENNMICMEVEE